MSKIQIKKESMVVKVKNANGQEEDQTIEYLSMKVRIRTTKGETDIKVKVNDKDKSLLNFLLSDTKVDENGVYQLDLK